MPMCRILAVILVPVVAGCATRGAVHVAPDESRPHITWDIRTGGDTGDATFVCGSAEPSTACVLAASTAEQRRLTTVHLYLHAAAEATSYLGVLSAPFLDGVDQRKGREVSATVPAGSQPVGVTIAAFVTSTPGTYTLGIRLDANQAAAATPMRILEELPVVVK
jgi:hypothetical protein